MKLFELFDRTVPWKWENRSGPMLFAVFQVENVDYEVSFELFPTDGQYGAEKLYSIEFNLLDSDNPFKTSNMITNTGNALVVFSTVVKIIQDLLSKTTEPVLLHFASSADEPSRIKLYSRMIQKFIKQPNIEIVKTRQKTKFTEYFLKVTPK